MWKYEYEPGKWNWIHEAESIEHAWIHKEKLCKFTDKYVDLKTMKMHYKDGPICNIKRVKLERKWEYELVPGKWVPITDKRIDMFFEMWQETGEESGLVYHCFGDGMSVGIGFSTMKTYCLSGHSLCVLKHNEFKIRFSLLPLPANKCLALARLISMSRTPIQVIEGYGTTQEDALKSLQSHLEYKGISTTSYLPIQTLEKNKRFKCFIEY